jgi:uncharacterized protein
MSTRRRFLENVAVGSGFLMLPRGLHAAGALARELPIKGTLTPAAERLYDTIRTYPVDDTHCHPLTSKDAQTTPDSFLERICLAAFPAPSYFPQGLFEKWRTADPSLKQQLDQQYKISATLSEINRHFAETAFVKYMTKEMAAFLGCAPKLREVIEARNERGKNYAKYMYDLFQDVKLANVMIDTGYAEDLDASGMQTFARTISPTQVRAIARIETIEENLLTKNLSFDDLVGQFLQRVRDALDGTGNFGLKSYGLKSYLLPVVGLIHNGYDPIEAELSWNELKKVISAGEAGDREAAARRGQKLLEYLLTLALEECLARDMPMQFHAGDGEAPDIILRNQHPFYLEEVVRFEKNGILRMPKIIPVHAGYPLVSEAAWLSHLYTNCYFELSIMAPFVHQGLADRLRQVMEVVPLSKILFGSDAYHVPEIYWLAGRWGKRFLSEALGVYTAQGILTEDEALEAARRILYQNNREVYHLT